MSSTNRRVVPVPPYNFENSTQHWLSSLQRDYSRTERNPKLLPTHQAVPTPLVQYIFIMSKKLNLSVEVKYLAVDLFDRFIRTQLKSVYSEVFASLNQHSSKRWEKVEKKICNQLELRILSCLQIASKFISENSSKSKSISSREIYEFLGGESFSLQEINNSEFRVFKTLDFRIGSKTVITFVDSLIISIYEHMYGTTEFEDVQIKCYQVCEVLYLNHQEIFNIFYQKLTGLWERSYNDRLSFSSVECNCLIKSAAAVLTAAKSSRTSDEKEKILRKELARLTSVSEEAIESLSEVIIQHTVQCSASDKDF